MDDQDASTHRSDLTSNLSEVGEFGLAIIDELQTADHGLKKFLTEDLRKDLPTGQTPSRVQTDFPRRLIQGTPDDERLNKFRLQRGDLVPQKFDNFDEDDDDSVVSFPSHSERS